MTGARWTSIIFGILCLGSLKVKMVDTNFWDCMFGLCALLVPAAFIIVPLVLEFMDNPGSRKIVTLPNTNDMVKRLHDVCKAHESCKECPLISSKTSFCLTLGDPERWNTDEIITKLQEAGK